MADSKSYYSILQFCPDVGRGEAANVGVVIDRPEPHAIAVKTRRTFSRVKRFFKPDREELWFIRDAVRAAATALQVRAHDYQTFEEFEQMPQSMGNEVRLTQPRIVCVDVPYRDVERLFQQLVEVETRRAWSNPAIVLWPFGG